MLRRMFLLAFLPLFASTAFATIFASVRGIIHDPQHHPIQGAEVTLTSLNSDWSRTFSWAFRKLPQRSMYRKPPRRFQPIRSLRPRWSAEST